MSDYNNITLEQLTKIIDDVFNTKPMKTLNTITINHTDKTFSADIFGNLYTGFKGLQDFLKLEPYIDTIIYNNIILTDKGKIREFIKIIINTK